MLQIGCDPTDRFLEVSKIGSDHLLMCLLLGHIGLGWLFKVGQVQETEINVATWQQQERTGSSLLPWWLFFDTFSKISHKVL